MRYLMVQDNSMATLSLMDDQGEVRIMEPVWSALQATGDAPDEPASLDALLRWNNTQKLADQLEARFSEGLPVAGELVIDVPLRGGDIFCIGRNYVEHARELGNEVPSEPIVFMKPRASLIATGETILLPKGTEEVHHEGELTLVLGGRVEGNVSQQKAESALFGVTLMNDVTDRARQNELKKGGKPWLVAKGQKTFAPLGPVVRRFDSEFRLSGTRVETKVNGELRQSGGPDLWIFGLSQLLSYLGVQFGLCPGDLVATGTPAGVGPLRAGDWIEISCPGVGTLTNPVSIT